MLAFGPAPSRRLGRSVGVNNIPPKACTYSCVYCQLGRTKKMRMERREFYPSGEILAAVRDKVEQANRCGAVIDYLTFVADGEPTLDMHLGQTISLLRPLAIKIAVITNASLIWREDVRADLGQADWVSLKVDALCTESWRTIDRPHGGLKLTDNLDGMLTFAGSYAGELVTETMLVQGINDSDQEIDADADFLARLKPARAYLSIPTRPPAEQYVRPPAEAMVNRAYQHFSKKLATVEYLIGYEGNTFSCTGDVAEDLC
jgi:wyosine [tRNA(Phe)-imidazoG37] synthetase (radical SAM superfamily)